MTDNELSALVTKYLNMSNKYKALYEDARNELCLKCGKYEKSHLGACEGCKWTTLE